MVVGSGLVATRFKSYSDDSRFLIFASGVSNSKTTSEQEYQREFELIKNVVSAHPDKHFVYFSTCSIYDPAEQMSAYVLFKQEIEEYIRINIENHTVFRVSNLVGNSPNPNTILNFLTRHVLTGQHFNLWAKATRNLIDSEDFYHIADYTLQNGYHKNSIVNIANTHSYPVKDIVEAIEHFYGKKANYTSLDKGQPFYINTESIKPIITELNIAFDSNYLEMLLQKYY